MNDNYRLRDNLEKMLDGIHEEMLQKKRKKRIPFLRIEIQKWEQKILNDKVKFRRLLHEGNLNINPETFENELDEEELAIGRMYLWISAAESGVDLVGSGLEKDDEPEEAEDNGADYSEADPRNQNNQYMDIHQVAKYLQVSDSYIYRLSSEGEIPRIKLGNLVRFDRDDIDNWMRKKRG